MLAGKFIFEIRQYRTYRYLSVNIYLALMLVVVHMALTTAEKGIRKDLLSMLSVTSSGMRMEVFGSYVHIEGLIRRLFSSSPSSFNIQNIIAICLYFPLQNLISGYFVKKIFFFTRLAPWMKNQH